MRRSAKLLVGLAAFMTIGIGNISAARAQGFLELEQTPAFIGAGVGSVPDYKGSDDRSGGVAPYARYTFAGQQRYVQLFANELSLNLIDSQKYRFGPVINYHFGRDSDVEDDVVRQMREIDDTVELGLFGDVAWVDPGNPRNRLIVGGMLLQDAGGESDGLRARLSARYWRQVHRAVDVHVGAGFMYGDRKYNDHYFGINADNVGSAPLPAYKAGSGIHEAYVNLGTALYLSKEWVLGAGLRYGRITGDAADSPLVDQRGSENQVIGGIGVAYIGWR